jgi:hypothetical protein
MKKIEETPILGLVLNREPVSGLVSVTQFRDDLGVVPSTLWRWKRKGWIDEPINIGGRLYLTVEMIKRFKERAAAGEFAVSVKPPTKNVLQPSA